MPWKVSPVSQLRASFVHAVQVERYTVAQACRHFGISRKTGYKWLRRAQQPAGCSFEDHSRRPHRSPARTSSAIEERVLALRDQYGWGARKLRAVLLRQGQPAPSVRTVHAVLQRHERLTPPPPAAPEPQAFVRSKPNELWQLDFKGPLEVRR